MAYIHLYNGNPTDGGTDGNEVALAGDTSSGANFIKPGSALNASTGETSDAIKLAIRCDDGYSTTGNTVIACASVEGATISWALAADEGGIPSSTRVTTLTISDTIGATNYIFWAYATATASGTPLSESATVTVTADVVAS